MRCKLLFPLLLLACVINGLPAVGAPPGLSMHLKLLRRHHRHRSPLQRVREIARNDHARAKMIADRIGWRRSACEAGDGSPQTSSFAMPISSAAFTGTGQYFVRLKVGTPAQTFLLVADTGSDLTWMKCRYRACRGCGDAQWRRAFRADQSSSFSPIPCSSQLCKNSLPFSLAKCLVPTSPCEYDYGYVSLSSSPHPPPQNHPLLPHGFAPPTNLSLSLSLNEPTRGRKPYCHQSDDPRSTPASMKLR